MAIEALRDRDWLLLPGTLCTAEVFDGVLDALAIPAQRRVPVALDLPSVEDYAAILAPRAEGAVLCGFSLGAIVAAHLADRLAPARTFLFGLNPYPDDSSKAEDRHALAREVRAMGGARAMMPRLPPLGGPHPARARKAILAMADAPHDIEAQTRLALSRPGALPALSRTRGPVHFLTGSEDTSAPSHMGKAAAKAAPSGQFRELTGLGHYALLEDPAACARAVLDIEEARP
jgi:pimeloyl-ACP methyl ester carboxylesterase